MSRPRADPDRLLALASRPLAGGLRVFSACSRRERARGLRGLDALPADWGLTLTRCRSVHTFGVRMRLDLLWLDGAGEVVRVDRDVGARRLRTCRRARSVLEVGAGGADRFLAAGAGTAA